MSASIALEEAQIDEQQFEQHQPVHTFGARVTKVAALIGASALVISGGTAAARHSGGAAIGQALGGRRLLSELELDFPFTPSTAPAEEPFAVAVVDLTNPAQSRSLIDGACSNDGEDCRETQCCTTKESTCFRKNDHWASCNASCSHNYKWWNNGWVYQGDEHIWDCHTLSCSDDGQNCMSSRCCTDPNSKCYRKNDEWASCNATCTHNYKWEGSSGWVEKAEKIWDCVELLPKQECDMTGCDHCSGEQCEYCRDNKERDCCLDDACRGAQGEQVAQCRKDHLEACCQGKSAQCKGGEDSRRRRRRRRRAGARPTTPAPGPQCDTSSCTGGCEGVQCVYCTELLERNCCLEEACKDSPNDSMCFTDNLEKCCLGKSVRCQDQHGPAPKMVEAMLFKQ